MVDYAASQPGRSLRTRALHRSAALGLRLCGWRTEGSPPPEPKFVLVAAPHTSNWDAVFMRLAAYVFELKLAWLGKAELFHGPQGRVLKWFGGVPVSRESAHGAVADAVRVLAQNESVALAIPPEATRYRTSHWKMGFYLIARRARVPMVLGFVDYRRRVVGLGPALYPSGDVEADMEIIRRFYSGVTARFPEEVGEIRAAPR